MVKDTGQNTNNPFAKLKLNDFPDKPLEKSDKPLFQKSQLVIPSKNVHKKNTQSKNFSPKDNISNEVADEFLEDEDNSLFFANMVAVEKLPARKESRKGKSTKPSQKQKSAPIKATESNKFYEVSLEKDAKTVFVEKKSAEENTLKNEENSQKHSFASLKSLQSLSLQGDNFAADEGMEEKMPAMQKTQNNQNSKGKTQNTEYSEEDLFFSAVFDVESLHGKGRDISPSPVLVEKPKPIINQIQDEFAENLKFSLHVTDTYIESHVIGLDLMTVGKLQARQYNTEAHIDLHGLTIEQAYLNLIAFFRNAYYRGLRALLVVTGQGKNSVNGNAILRNKACEWFTNDPFKRVILAFCSAKIEDGGAGALYVLIRKPKKDFGEINWDMSPSDPELFL